VVRRRAGHAIIMADSPEMPVALAKVPLNL